MRLPIFIVIAEFMIHQQANIVFRQRRVLRFSVVVHLASRPASYPLRRATSDFAPERGQVCQQLIHYAEYQLVSTHKQSIFDTRGSWIMGATAEEMQLADADCSSLLVLVAKTGA